MGLAPSVAPTHARELRGAQAASSLRTVEVPHVERRLQLPTQLASGRSECFCGTPIDIDGFLQHIYEHHMSERKL
jgi:hypothetical protein